MYAAKRMLDTSPLAPSAMLTAFKNPTQNTKQSKKAKAGIDSKESSIGAPIEEGTNPDHCQRIKPKRNAITPNRILGESSSLRISSTRPNTVEPKMATQTNLWTCKGPSPIPAAPLSINTIRTKIPPNIHTAPPSRDACISAIPCLWTESVAHPCMLTNCIKPIKKTPKTPHTIKAMININSSLLVSFTDNPNHSTDKPPPSNIQPM